MSFELDGLAGACCSLVHESKQTVVELIRHSSAGLDAGEMRSLLGLAPRSFLSSFADHPQIKREKSQGRFVYYCADRSVYSGQQQCRSDLNADRRQPTAFEAIAILVEKIKHPALSNEALSRRLKKQKLSVPPETIKNLFVRHGLAEKKRLFRADPLPFGLSCQIDGRSSGIHPVHQTAAGVVPALDHAVRGLRT